MVLKQSSSAAGPAIRQSLSGAYQSGWIRKVTSCTAAPTAASAGRVSAVGPLNSPLSPLAMVRQHSPAVTASRTSSAAGSGVLPTAGSSGAGIGSPAPAAAVPR